MTRTKHAPKLTEEQKTQADAAWEAKRASLQASKQPSEQKEAAITKLIKAAKVAKSTSVPKKAVSAKLAHFRAQREAYIAERAKPHPNGGVIYIAHLPLTMTETALKQFLLQFGEVKRIHFPLPRKSSLKNPTNKGYAWVEFPNKQVAAIVAESMDKYMLKGRTLVCKYVPYNQLHPQVFRNTFREHYTEDGHAQDHAARTDVKSVEQIQALRAKQAHKLLKQAQKFDKLGYSMSNVTVTMNDNVIDPAQPTSPKVSKDAKSIKDVKGKVTKASAKVTAGKKLVQLPQTTTEASSKSAPVEEKVPIGKRKAAAQVVEEEIEQPKKKATTKKAAAAAATAAPVVVEEPVLASTKKAITKKAAAAATAATPVVEEPVVEEKPKRGAKKAVAATAATAAPVVVEEPVVEAPKRTTRSKAAAATAAPVVVEEPVVASTKKAITKKAAAATAAPVVVEEPVVEEKPKRGAKKAAAATAAPVVVEEPVVEAPKRTTRSKAAAIAVEEPVVKAPKKRTTRSTQ